MTTPKLTAAQERLLREIERGRRIIPEHCPAAVKLERLSLAEVWDKNRPIIRITALGRSVLTTLDETRLAERGFQQEGGVREPI